MSKIIVDKKLNYKYRFEMKYAKGKTDDDCWNWIAGKNKKGYGLFGSRKNHNKVTAHRISYEMYIGEIPTNKLVCHTCDNPSCVNPKHLWLGTIQENNIDRDKKGRFIPLIGEKHPMCKITEELAKEIKKRIRR